MHPQLPLPPMLRAAGLTMSYPGGSQALTGLTVEVPAASVGLVNQRGRKDHPCSG